MKIVKEKYQIVAKDWSNETYWACFAFEDEIPDDLHCTHKFFGEQTENMRDAILNTMENYFTKNPYQTIEAKFDHEEFFGENKDVRVLRLEDSASLDPFLLDLRKKLDAFADDRFPGYKPHVTTDLDVVEKPLTRYCFCQGDKILREWKAEEKETVEG